MDYTTDELVSTLILRTQLAQAAQKFEEKDFITFLNYEMQDNIVPAIAKLNEEYLIDDLEFDTVPGQTFYSLPPRLRAPTLRDLRIVYPTINSTPNLGAVPRLTPEAIAGGSCSYSYFQNQQHFYQGNNLGLRPTPTTVQTYSMLYLRQPNNLCSTDDAAQVTSINAGTNTIIAAVPSSWTTANTIDVVSPNPNPQFALNAQNVSIVSVSSPTIVVSDVTGIQIGDWVSLSGTSPIPCIPLACRNALIQATAIRVLESIGDTDRISTTTQIYLQNLEAMNNALSQRTKGESLHVSSNGDGIADWQAWNRSPF